MDRITEITESLFNALAQLETLEQGETPMPELLHQQLSTYIEQAARTGSKLGLAQRDIDDIRYALVALADEVVVNRGGALRDFWMNRKLALRFLDDANAGEGFFERLRGMLGDSTRTEAKKAYYLSLMFGFQGKYRVRGGELELADITDRLRDELVRAKALTTETSLSPKGPRPYEAIADGRRNMLLVWLSVTAAVSSVLLYIGLRLQLMNNAERLVERLSGLVGM
ncbi:MAG TPA: DotU family type IV/VI secretion system protein [Polyangiales bacterium]|nr:DotU family type IV/VI secretion system protein [Polyangiales bacterium]